LVNNEKNDGRPMITMGINGKQCGLIGVFIVAMPLSTQPSQNELTLWRMVK
jgi:hypothetical protein